MAIVHDGGYEVVLLKPGESANAVPRDVPTVELKQGSTVEIRELPTRFIFVDGKPLRQPLEEPTAPLEGQAPPR